MGGGITGAGIALDAASRGLSTVLVEKEDFAFGTSSRSTKLIHGGLRYLKQLEFGLVREVGSERAVVHRLAPHLVIPEKMLLPLYEKRGFGSILTSVGLKLYDWLAGVRPEDQRRMLTRRQTLRQEPMLLEHDVKGGAIYAEYRTDDARLTLEIVKTAWRHGAVPLSYCQADTLIYEGERLKGLNVTDRIGGQSFPVTAKAIVNASGPWVDELREKDNSRKGKRLHLTKGVHVVVARDRLPVTQAIYFNVDDGRMIFAIPRGITTYVGTTDTSYEGSKDDVRTTAEDVAYLLSAVNKTFNVRPLTSADVMSSWSGLRPLIHEDGKSASELSRKDEIFESESGLISIAGGKLTGYRKMAERVVDLVLERHFEDASFKKCHTSKIGLTAEPFASRKEVGRYVGQVARELMRLGGSVQIASYLIHTYGRATKDILEHIVEKQGTFDEMLTASELDFTVRNEMVLSATDFFIRRTGMLFFDIERMKHNATGVINDLEGRYSWDSRRTEDERNKISNSIKFASQF